MTSRCFLVGAPDPEMYRMIALLIERGEVVVEAKRDGVRVHPGNAYTANNAQDIPPGAEVTTIECACEGVTPTAVIDHHRPGDPGYDMPAEAYWEASSPGQLYRLLDVVTVVREDRVLAAMDHCYNAAMRGLCPGVSRNEVFERKIAEIAHALKVSIVDVERAVATWSAKLSTCQSVAIGAEQVLEVPHTGIGYSLQYLCVQVAAILEDVPIVVELQDHEDTPVRLHLCGNVLQDTVHTFMEVWAPAHGLQRIYGSPERGYAGGYIA